MDDPRQVKKANPASWITVAGLRAQREAVPDLAYRRYHATVDPGRRVRLSPRGLGRMRR